ncbi:hypothetical protein AC578_3913 [Pseudocercospora eumusae]|uniref:Uncharacterized protein n=1 Tax=Pseudocercospora eumusae TaxID=321146 RepID=A0A139H0L9_9PEZI|nr:hypothetical protein AC578_3913 [Pseudocercospora eumusae]
MAPPFNLYWYVVYAEREEPPTLDEFLHHYARSAIPQHSIDQYHEDRNFVMGSARSDDLRASTPYEQMAEDEPGSAAAGPSLSSTTHIRDFALRKAPAAKTITSTSTMSSADFEKDVLLVVITDRAYGS